MESEFIGRQPIVNRNQVILGYRLLYGGLPDVQYDPTGEPAAVQAPAAHLAKHFQEALGEATGFIEIDIDDLDSSFVDALPAKQFVIEIGPIGDRDQRPIHKCCKELRERGLRICLGNYGRRDNRAFLLEFASYIKIDALATSDSEINTIVRRMRKQNVEIVASRVDLPTQFENLVEAGIDLFQGYFYARHDPASENELSPDRVTIVELLSRVSVGAELYEVEETFKKHANLGVSLLRLVNGLQLARSVKIDNVNQALVMIGAHGLSRWLNILLFAGAEEDGEKTPLFKLASSRGKLMELLQLQLLSADLGREEKDIVERAFLIGMLSLAHIVLGVSQLDAIEQLNLSDEIQAAVEHHQGVAGSLLELTKCLEDSDMENVQALLESLKLSRTQLQVAQSETYAWVNAL